MRVPILCKRWYHLAYICIVDTRRSSWMVWAIFSSQSYFLACYISILSLFDKVALMVGAKANFALNRSRPLDDLYDFIEIWTKRIRIRKCRCGNKWLFHFLCQIWLETKPFSVLRNGWPLEIIFWCHMPNNYFGSRNGLPLNMLSSLQSVSCYA